MPDPVLTPAQTVTPASGVPGLCDVRLSAALTASPWGDER